MKPTIKEIAKKSGYGVGTVSRALSTPPFLVKKETRDKILKIAEEYGYVKDFTAQALVSGNTKDIGFVIPAMFGSPFYNDFSIKLISGILNALSFHDLKMRVLFLKERAGFNEIMREIKALKLRGLILCPYFQKFYIKESDLKQLGLPIVVLSRHLKGNNIKSVILDDLKGGYDGTSYLIRLGHQRIAVIRGVRKDIEARYEGYLKALEDNKIKARQDLIARGDGMENTGYTETLRLLKAQERPTAIFCLDDEMAIGAMKALKYAGLSCPDDISILGFDGMEISKYTDPRLSTMVRPVALMGEKAVELLLGEGKGRKRSNCLKVSAILDIGGSCRSIK